MTLLTHKKHFIPGFKFLNLKTALVIAVVFFHSFCPAEKTLFLHGAGATLPYILYSKWFSEYAKINTKAKINYRSIGSGGGIRQLIKGTLDFGASDVPLKPEEMKKSKIPIIQVPSTLSAVVISFNLKELKDKTLLLTPELISEVFRGVITKWNDPRLTALNKDLEKVNKDIVVVYRADGSGTTGVFTDYLSQTSPAWLKEVGKGKSVNWPRGIGGKGNEGVLGLVQKIEGSLAYLAMSYAVNQKLNMAKVKNLSGNFVAPSAQAVQSAAKNAVKKNNSHIKSIVNSEGKDDYPISSFTYLLVYEKMTEAKGPVLVEFLKWALDEGQKYSKNLHFTALPQNVIKQALLEIQKIHWTENKKP